MITTITLFSLLAIIINLNLAKANGRQLCDRGAGGVSHCQGTKFICNNGTVSGSKKICSSATYNDQKINMKNLLFVILLLAFNLSFAKEVIDMQIDHPLNVNIASVAKEIGKPVKKGKVDNEPGTANYVFTKSYPDFTIQSFKDHIIVHWDKAGSAVKDIENSVRVQKAITAILGERMWLKVSANLDKPTQINTPKVKIFISSSTKSTLVNITPIK